MKLNSFTPRLMQVVVCAQLAYWPNLQAADALHVRLAACQSCHGQEGVNASADIPNLAGQKRDYLASQLKAFKDGSRKNDLMSVIAGQLSDTDITALAGYWSALPAVPAAAGAKTTAAASVSLMRVPADFPKGFTEYYRSNDDDSKQIQVSYANAPALAAARAKRELPDGSYIMLVNYNAVLDSAGKPQADAQGRWKLGKLVAYNGMESRAGWGEAIPELLRNGNWHYGLFNADGTSRLNDMQPRCFACHKPQAKDSYLFGLSRML